MTKYKVVKHVSEDIECLFRDNKIEITHEYYIEEITQTLAHEEYKLTIEWDSLKKRVWVFLHYTFLHKWGGLEEAEQYIEDRFKGSEGIPLNINEKEFDVFSQLVYKDLLDYLQIEMKDIEMEEI